MKINSITSTLVSYTVGINCDEIVRSEVNDTETLTCFRVAINGAYTYVSLLEEHTVEYMEDNNGII